MIFLADGFGLGELFITPHSLRRGSATSLFRACGSFDVVADEGRWESVRTCRKYIDQSIAELGEFSVFSEEKFQDEPS